MSDLPDMLVELGALPDPTPYFGEAEEFAVIRRIVRDDQVALKEFIETNFSASWATAVDVSFGREPATMYVALASGRFVGFAVYNAAHLGTFGPIGVKEDWRERGIGGALLLRCLVDMREQGYAYAVIRQVGPADFYRKVCGATLIGTPSKTAQTQD